MTLVFRPPLQNRLDPERAAGVVDDWNPRVELQIHLVARVPECCHGALRGRGLLRGCDCDSGILRVLLRRTTVPDAGSAALATDARPDNPKRTAAARTADVSLAVVRMAIVSFDIWPAGPASVEFR